MEDRKRNSQTLALFGQGLFQPLDEFITGSDHHGKPPPQFLIQSDFAKVLEVGRSQWLQANRISQQDWRTMNVHGLLDGPAPTSTIARRYEESGGTPSSTTRRIKWIWPDASRGIMNDAVSLLVVR